MTKNQKQVLMAMFRANPYPGREEFCHAASTLNTSMIRIEHWFYVMRKKKKAEGVLIKGQYKLTSSPIIIHCCCHLPRN